MVYNQLNARWMTKLVARVFSGLTLLFKPLLVLCLVIVLAFGTADGAWAASSGGRVGGGSFRAPTPPRPVAIDRPVPDPTVAPLSPILAAELVPSFSCLCPLSLEEEGSADCSLLS